MKKYIEIEMGVLERLVDGKCVEGSLRRNEWTGKICFRAYNRQSRNHPKDREGQACEETALGLGEGVDAAHQGVWQFPEGCGNGAGDGLAAGSHP